MEEVINAYYKSLEELYMENYKLVYAYIMDYSKDQELVGEVSSIVWLKVSKKGTHFLEMEKKHVKNYLRVMAKNATKDYISTNKREMEKEKIVYEYTKGCNNVEVSAEDVIVRSGENEILFEILSKLTDAERDFIMLKYWNQLSVKELKEVYSTTESAVRVKNFRILKKLRKSIEELK